MFRNTELNIDLEKFTQLTSMQTSYDDWLRIFLELDTEVRERDMIANMITVFRETRANGSQLYVVVGADHIENMVNAIRAELSQRQIKGVRIAVDASKLKMVAPRYRNLTETMAKLIAKFDAINAYEAK